jgi:choice-of-anchor B domain-containing protein
MSRATRYLFLAFALLVPLAFGPLLNPSQDTGQHVNDGKARALADLAQTPHEQLDAAKAERVRTAMLEAQTVDVEVSTPAPCIAGFAGPYPCENVDLAAVVPLAELGGAAGNDSWGWTDPVTGDEIAIVGTGTGVAFVDVTEPTEPRVLGRVESEVIDRRVLWRDVKVDDDHAFIVSENAGHGMQVFDLTRLRNSVGTSRKVFAPDAVYEGFGSAHNIAVNTDSDTAYAVGTDTCEGGLHMVDISDPLNPVAAGAGDVEDSPGCYAGDGYTHDVQCVNYDGPDDDYNGTPGTAKQGAKANPKAANAKTSAGPAVQHEICFAANEDSVTIVDVTDKDAPEMISKVTYDTAGYTHQGWLTPDKKWFVFDDELDEDPVLGAGTVDNTTTYMLNVTDLDLGKGDLENDEWTGVSGPEDDPLVKSFSHDTESIDHNLYITDDELIWEANYNAGLRVMREVDFANGELEQVGFFDTDPGVDVKAYGDSWNVYPFFESGTVIVSNLGQGLLVLQPNYHALHASD